MTNGSPTDMAAFEIEAATSPHERKYHALKSRVEKRNFRLGVTNGVLYGLGTYFISRSTVIPSFFSHLTRSSALIGIVSQFESIGWYLPQFFVASFLVHRSRKLPLYRMATWIRGSAFLLISDLFFCAVRSSPQSVLFQWPLCTNRVRARCRMNEDCWNTFEKVCEFIEPMRPIADMSTRGSLWGRGISASRFLSCSH